MIGISTVDINGYLDAGRQAADRIDFSELRLLRAKKD
jgi:hypothetical protein